MKKGPLILATSVVPNKKKGLHGVKVTPNTTTLSFYDTLTYSVYRVNDGAFIASKISSSSPVQIWGLAALTDYYVVITVGSSSSPNYYFTSL